MNKLYIAIAGIVLVFAAQPLPAQHDHGGGSSAGGEHAGGSGSLPDSNHAFSAFQKALAVQATEEQSVRLRSWIRNTAALNQQLEDIRNLSGSNDPAGFSSKLQTFKSALEAHSLVGHNLLADLSGAQRSGLKGLVRRLDKANADLVHSTTEIGHSSGSRQDTKVLVKGLLRVKKAIFAEQLEQQQLASEMGTTT